MVRVSTSARPVAISRFVDPPWRAPLDAEAEIRAIPESAQVRGLLIAPMLLDAKKRGVTRQFPRERYVAFNLYPLREHARWLIDTANEVFPEKPTREALRKLGRAAANAFVASTLGKVTLGAAEGVHDIVTAFAKGYELNMQPGSAVIVDSQPRRIVVRVDEVHHFLDCHHVGAFEGAMNRADIRGRVTIAMRGTASADLLLEW